MTRGPMHRRSFLTLLGASAAALPLPARAQNAKRVGVLMNGRATDFAPRSYLATLTEGLRKLGWVDGQNLRLEVRFNEGDAVRADAYATDLVGLFKPDVLLHASSVNLIAAQRATTTIPIVFTQVRDLVEQGFVSSLTRPGGNVTGFANSEFSIAGKWADLLKQMVPSLKRVAAIFNPDTTPQSKFYLNAVGSAASSLDLELLTTPLHNATEIEPTVANLARRSNIGLIFLPDTFTILRAKLIIELVARYRLPAIYGVDPYFDEGGLMRYANDVSEQSRQAPYYIDRILKGTKPGELPVQLPTKFKFMVNRKTASALGIEVPLGILLAADEVIE